jgi:hypothetical protein
MEERLNAALDEAWAKVNVALDQMTRESGDISMSIWAAAEAVEYASLIFNLTHGMEDIDPRVKTKRKRDLLVLVKDSVESLKRARELRRKSATEAYESLRNAADNLKTVYLDKIKETARKPR